MTYTKGEVRFPQGWGMMSTELPGVRMASVLRLPNVGAEPTTEWRFSSGSSGASPDWSFMLPTVLKAFWSEANVTEPAYRQPDVGWMLRYSSPVVSKKVNTTERLISLTWLGGATWQDEADGSCLSIEWIRQRDSLGLPDATHDYKVLMALRRNSNGEPGITGLMRVAGFLQPLDGLFIEANGEAAVVYDYEIRLTPKESTSAT